MPRTREILTLICFENNFIFHTETANEFLSPIKLIELFKKICNRLLVEEKLFLSISCINKSIWVIKKIKPIEINISVFYSGSDLEVSHLLFRTFRNGTSFHLSSSFIETVVNSLFISFIVVSK